MKTTTQIESNRPKALQTVADVDKAAAITAACKAVAGQAPEARIEMIDYNERFAPKGPFRRYAEIRFSLFAQEGGETPEAIVEALQRVDDATLVGAIASQLGKLAGEDYEGYIATKHIGVGKKLGGAVANIRMQLAVE